MNRKGISEDGLRVIMIAIFLGVLFVIGYYLVTKYSKSFDDQLSGQVCDLSNGVITKTKAGFKYWRAADDCPCDENEGFKHHYEKQLVVGAMINYDKVPKEKRDSLKKCETIKYVCFMDTKGINTDDSCFPINVKVDNTDLRMCGFKFLTTDYEGSDTTQIGRRIKAGGPSAGGSGEWGTISRDWMKTWTGPSKDVLMEHCVVDSQQCLQGKKAKCDEYFKTAQEENGQKQ